MKQLILIFINVLWLLVVIAGSSRALWGYRTSRREENPLANERGGNSR